MWRLVVVNLLFASSVLAINGKCRILALGGGTDKGAYQAGAIIGLIQSLPSGEAVWDVVTGNGVGAFNAIILGNYALGQEASAISVLNNTWSTFTPNQFYKQWPGGEITGIYWEKGLFDTSPMGATINKKIPSTFQRWTAVGATDLISGNYVLFNSSFLDSETMATGVKASLATQGEFPWIPFSNLQLSTGCIKYTVDILDAVTACTNKGYTTDQMFVDVIMVAGKTIQQIDASKFKTPDAFHRYLEISAFQDTMRVEETVNHDYPDVTVRNLIFPSQTLNSSSLPYDYDATELKAQIALGMSDAKSPNVTLSYYMAFQ
mmetsp:Transcript_17148/g.17048  ORF Transcript_17148/g.17048 Transcript_17148/m.17048 type:complete len:319 (-) Transcript_17148:28-984(-)